MYSSPAFEDVRKVAVSRAKEKRERDERLFTRQLGNGQLWGDSSDLDARFLPLSLSITMKREVIACSDDCTAMVGTGASHIQGPGRLVDNIQKLIGATPRGSKVKGHTPGSLPVSTNNKDLQGRPLTLSL